MVNHVVPYNTCVRCYFEEMDLVVALLYIREGNMKNIFVGGGDVMKGEFL
jgi:hypothetical protein